MSNTQQGKTLVVVGYSGGIDSLCTTMYYLDKGCDVIAVNIDYGQTQAIETQIAKKTSQYIQEHKRKYLKCNNTYKLYTIHLGSPYKQIIAQSLGLDIRDLRYLHESVKKYSDLLYYYPSRNLIIASLLLATLETYLYAKDLESDYDTGIIALGIHKHVTYDNYWDTTRDFLDKLNSLIEVRNNAKHITFKNVYVEAPFLEKSKEDIIQLALERLWPIHMAWTCYNPIVSGDRVESCRECQACKERAYTIDQLASVAKSLVELYLYYYKISSEQLKYPIVNVTTL